MTDDAPDDYFSAAAGVVDAAQNLAIAQRRAKELFNSYNKVIMQQTAAEKALEEALEKLKGTSTGRSR